MTGLPLNIYSVADVREFDRNAIEGEGIPGYTLMSRAGAAFTEHALTHYPDSRHWHIVCGAGNNAGDGYVIARLAMERGKQVSVSTLVTTSTLKGDAKTAFEDFRTAGGEVEEWLGTIPDDADLLVDALLGSGLQREVSGDFAAVVSAMNEHVAPVIAVDLPSGLHGDSGAIMGCCVEADASVTFVGLKSGMFLGKGPDVCGDIVFDGLAIPPVCYENATPVLTRISASDTISRFPPRQRSAHKGDFGHVLIVGGGPGMPGAALLCGEAALRSGAGRVTLATHPDHAVDIVAERPELMSRAVADGDELASIIDEFDVIAFGPGLGRSEWAQSVYDAVAASEKPSVWDADALNLLAERTGVMPSRVITPHPGEAATLLGIKSGAVQSTRLESVTELQRRYGGVSVLKGSRSLVSDGNAVPSVCLAGNPGMAAPGMGDALTGIIAALLAQGFAFADAAACGVQVHAMAGDLAADRGERGLIVSDLISAVRTVVNP